MTSKQGYVDVANEPALLRIAEDVRETGKARVLRRGTEELAVVMPVSPRPRRLRRDRPFTTNDPLWNVAGIGHSTGPTDIATNKLKYLAEASSPTAR